LPARRRTEFGIVLITDTTNNNDSKRSTEDFLKLNFHYFGSSSPLFLGERALALQRPLSSLEKLALLALAGSGMKAPRNHFFHQEEAAALFPAGRSLNVFFGCKLLLPATLLPKSHCPAPPLLTPTPKSREFPLNLQA
jgi:hypothetical protein